MKIIICDVGNAASAFVTSSTGMTMMVDCGSNSEKENPVDVFYRQADWLGAKYFETSRGEKYPIALLHITHPDDDHVRNAARVKKDLTPYLLHKVKHEEYPDGDKVHTDYIQKIDKAYRGSNPETINWGFEINKSCSIPVSTCVANDDLKSKVRNNSSIIRYIKQDGVGILFCGDLEKPGWDYIVEHEQDFIKTLKQNGVNILIAPHHGHKSGFPKALFDEIGNVDVVIHSKDSEASKEGTDVSCQYSSKASGISYETLNNDELYEAKVLTTRSNGHIFISTQLGEYRIWTCKASSNHKKIA